MLNFFTKVIRTDQGTLWNIFKILRLKSDSKQGTPIDAILFFERRANLKYQESAILVSSQCGILEFWSMFGPLRPRGDYWV